MGPWLHALARDTGEEAAAQRFDEALAAFQAGRLAYDAFVVLAEQLYTGLAAGRRVTEVEAIAARLVREDPLRPGTRELVAALLQRGIRPILISGAPIEVLRAHASALGFAPDDVTGWTLERDGDRYAGRLVENTARGGTKARIVGRLVADGSTVELGLGDTEADRPLVEPARIGAWIDPVARDEQARVTWTEAETGVSTTGSLHDLAAVIRTR
jgi:phosphoserine phosphatase